ncbi:MAG: glycosyltransferase, partial [Acetobacteraceae bacterium]|nr:glycosyltransferase [Acetobacteraceae bacterium]
MILLAILSLLVWLYLVAAHGRFWQSGPVLAADRPRTAPGVVAVVPARNEARFIDASLRSLLAQDYPGPFRIVLVDDGSTDGTGAIARALGSSQIRVLTGASRPPGWSGKLWAVAQGVAEATRMGTGTEWPELILLTYADIVHDPCHLSTLVAEAERRDLDLVSEMVALSCVNVSERMLVPTFVFFFQLLYPFASVNDERRRIAAAAGGTILIRSRALDRIGGIEAVRGALIDDVALATAVKRGGRIWLGHTALARSVRPYPRFS